jgi:hypothetical protein
MKRVNSKIQLTFSLEFDPGEPVHFETAPGVLSLPERRSNSVRCLAVTRQF